MAKQGLLAQLKPSANTDTVFYSAPIDASASTVLTVANDGTGSAYDVAVKDYDQKVTLDASTYKLHEGDLITSSVVEVGTPISSEIAISPGDLITTSDQEKTFKSEIKKTKEMQILLNKFEISNSIIILDKKSKEKIEKSIRNIPNIKVTDINHFSAFDMVKFKKIVFTESSVKELEKRYE